MKPISFLRNIYDALMWRLTLRYLQRLSSRHVRDCPRMAVLSFDYIGHHINLFGRYERAELETLANLIRHHGSTGVALDVGANIGNHSIFFAELFAQVHAFEPNASLLPLLRYNLRKHPHVIVHPFGASFANTIMSAQIPDGNVGGGHVADDQRLGEPTQFELRRLDDVPELAAAEKIQFIKIDVEGHELQAIEGMATLISRHGPLIAVEQQPERVRNCSTDAIDRLRSLGYDHLYEIRSNQSRVPGSLASIFRAPLRLVEAGFGDPFKNASVERVNALEPRYYAMLVASRTPLDIS